MRTFESVAGRYSSSHTNHLMFPNFWETQQRMKQLEDIRKSLERESTANLPHEKFLRWAFMNGFGWERLSVIEEGFRRFALEPERITSADWEKMMQLRLKIVDEAAGRDPVR